MKAMIRVFAFAFSFTLIYMLYRRAEAGYSVPLFFAPSQAPTPHVTAKVSAAFALMVLGILFGRIHATLNRTATEVPVLEVLRRAIAGRQLLWAVVVAPIVFSGVYETAMAQPDWMIASLFSFQNGFFCEAILRRTAPDVPRNGS